MSTKKQRLGKNFGEKVIFIFILLTPISQWVKRKPEFCVLRLGLLKNLYSGAGCAYAFMRKFPPLWETITYHP